MYKYWIMTILPGYNVNYISSYDHGQKCLKPLVSQKHIIMSENMW